MFWFRPCANCRFAAFNPIRIAWANAGTRFVCPNCQANHELKEGRMIGFLHAIVMELGLLIGALAALVCLSGVLPLLWLLFSIPVLGILTALGFSLLVNVLRRLEPCAPEPFSYGSPRFEQK